jgi:hypothetical protein
MLNKMLLAFVVLGGDTHAQSVGRPQYMDRAIVQHNGAVATVIANAPIPLYQAISAIREEYGWRVNWEQAPCYSHLDLVDDKAPEWRNAHPESKGVTRPAGGTFRSVFPEITESSVANAKEALEQIVSDYNATDNPGKYALRAEADGQFFVVGTQVKDEDGTIKAVKPLLDTPITLTREHRTAYATLEAILAALSSASGQKVIMMSTPTNILRNTQVTVSGRSVPARQLLQQTLNSTNRSVEYELGYDPDNPIYILNVLMAGKAEDDGHGGKKLVPVDPPTV